MELWRLRFQYHAVSPAGSETSILRTIPVSWWSTENYFKTHVFAPSTLPESWKVQASFVVCTIGLFTPGPFPCRIPSRTDEKKQIGNSKRVHRIKDHALCVWSCTTSSSHLISQKQAEYLTEHMSSPSHLLNHVSWGRLHFLLINCFFFSHGCGSLWTGILTLHLIQVCCWDFTFCFNIFLSVSIL